MHGLPGFTVKVCDKDSINKELDHLNVVLQQNGFPPEKISLAPPSTTNNEIKQEFPTSICLPYLGITSHRIVESLLLLVQKSTIVLTKKSTNFYVHIKTKQTKTYSPGYIVFHVHAERCILVRQAVI